ITHSTPIVSTVTTPTGVETIGDAIPTEFTLNQNFPNPFNPSTTIRFALPEEAPVSLVIYNMLGVQIRTLVNGENLRAAFHQIAWDGKDDAGYTLPSGMYIYRITAGSFQSAKRMTLLK
ncbi:MAG TPA: T9SS type A sorting domain-containing protein, partial [Bacteroidota bacterium]